MKTIVVAMFFFATAVPFVDKPQRLTAPKEHSFQLKRK